MNATPRLTVLLLLPVFGLAAEPATVIEKAKQQISREFSYDPPAPTETAGLAEAAPDDNVVLLPSFTVSESRFSRDVERAVAKAQWKLEEQRFDWKNGGTIKELKLGGKTIEIGVWPNGPSLTLLQIKW
ncbi:MAG: hypothetical protein IT582_07630 [Opitutaceae bacterium]|nr:hypothetical protein [Opitutaceae bacterium]